MQNFNETLERVDEGVIAWSKKYTLTFSRIAISIVYVWFGMLKVFDVSPASPLVTALLAKVTFLQGTNPDAFVAVFGMTEVVIGLMFLVPRLERLAVFALALHMIAVTLPLVLLPDLAWSGFLAPTLEGQYVIKNVLLLAAAIDVLANLRSLRQSRSNFHV
jgi:uncharacterized membrane protein YkgB